MKGRQKHPGALQAIDALFGNLQATNHAVSGCPEGVVTFNKVLAEAEDALDFAFRRLLGDQGAPSVEVSRGVLDRILRVMVKSASWQNKGEYPTHLRVKGNVLTWDQVVAHVRRPR